MFFDEQLLVTFLKGFSNISAVFQLFTFFFETLLSVKWLYEVLKE